MSTSLGFGAASTAGRRSARATAGLVSLLALLLLLLPGTGAPALAGTATATDPDDVPLPLDVKSVSHANDESTITYRVQTYEDFTDKDLDFRWAIDRTGDGRADMFVSSQWEDSEQALVARVEDKDENQVAKAAIARPAPNAVQVSFARAVLKQVTSYAYSVRALTDLNDNGEADQGEVDLAPDSGWYQHDLAAAAAPAPPPSTSAEPPSPPAAAPPAAPAPPDPIPAPSSAAPNPRTPEASAAPPLQPQAAAPAPAATPPPRSTPRSVAPRRAEAQAQPPTSGPSAGAVSAAGGAALSATGPANVWLVVVAAALISIGIPCRVIGRRRRPKQGELEPRILEGSPEARKQSRRSAASD